MTDLETWLRNVPLSDLIDEALTRDLSPEQCEEIRRAAVTAGLDLAAELAREKGVHTVDTLGGGLR